MRIIIIIIIILLKFLILSLLYCIESESVANDLVYSVNIVFYLFRYYYYFFCCLRRVSYNTFRTYEWCAQIMQDLHHFFLHEIHRGIRSRVISMFIETRLAESFRWRKRRNGELQIFTIYSSGAKNAFYPS